MGDFNLRTENEPEREKLTSLFPKFKCFISGATFQQSSHFSSLDHILVSEDITDPFYCSHFKNIYTEHSAISFRFDKLRAIQYYDILCLQVSIWKKRRTYSSYRSY